MVKRLWLGRIEEQDHYAAFSPQHLKCILVHEVFEWRYEWRNQCFERWNAWTQWGLIIVQRVWHPLEEKGEFIAKIDGENQHKKMSLDEEVLVTIGWKDKLLPLFKKEFVK